MRHAVRSADTGPCGTLRAMFAHSTQTCQTWWWTAHPAAR
ncbi:trp operon leader peptide [Streptomyces parvulus]|uniref:Trp operon leader peptide n=1 Tax=Streptomyces parvulus TaxID=146923 RepID=A0A369VAS2_9ACTN|nr:trp operon leader peptide [Streptomyces parvulus]